MNKYTGIDYGMGKANIDVKNGIRYGVISMNSVSGYALDDLEYDYWFGCPNCGSDRVVKSKSLTYEYYCQDCKSWHMAEDCWGDESIGFHYTGEGYVLENCLDSDLMVLKSDFYTFAPFCSPCVPGAGNLNSASEYDSDSGVKTYCLGLDWLDENDDYTKCPYPVYSVETGELLAQGDID